MKLIYLRGKKNKAYLLKNCYYLAKYDSWNRRLQRNVGYEPLSTERIVAEILDKNGKAKPLDLRDKLSNEEIEKHCNSLGFEVDTSGLFYTKGFYRTWEERRKLFLTPS